jgi:hypothetical protein
MKRDAAWKATKAMMVSLGGASFIGAILTLHWILLCCAVGVAVGTWFLLYTMILEWDQDWRPAKWLSQRNSESRG